MEPSSQTTAGEEKKYVTLETGSKLSGYTQDYLERLCRLKKVDYRIWNNGQFVIELGSLLQETQTILLSNDGISFVDKGELADPVPEVVGSMLSSALKEVKTSTAMPEVPLSVPVVSVPVAPQEEVVPVLSAAPAPSLDIPLSESIVPTTPASAVVIPSIPTPPAPALVPDTPVVPSLSSAPQVGEDSVLSPIAKKIPMTIPPLAVPVAPRPLRVNTAVENIIAAQDALTPSPVVTPQVSIPVAPPPAPVVAYETPKEEAVVTTVPLLSIAVTPPPPAPLLVKQSVPFGSLPEQPKANASPVATPSHDDWDALILGDHPSVTSTPVAESLPQGSQYHPIKTSVDPRPHHDDGPLFPVLNPSGIATPQAVVSERDISPLSPPPAPLLVKQSVPFGSLPEQPKANASPVATPSHDDWDALILGDHSADTPALPPSLVASVPVSIPSDGSGQQHVTVFAPEDLLAAKPRVDIPAPALESSASLPSVPQKPGVINHELPEFPSVQVSEKLAPVVPTAVVRREGTVPSLRVMPGLPAIKDQNLPMVADEHHLSLPEEHSLAKSIGLNLVFAAFIFGSSALLLNSAFPELGKKLTDFNSTSYVAGVGAAFTGEPAPSLSTSDTSKELQLPFSDEVTVDPGSKPNSVIVRPVFKAGLGDAYEYAITPVAAGSSTAP